MNPTLREGELPREEVAVDKAEGRAQQRKAEAEAEAEQGEKTRRAEVEAKQAEEERDRQEGKGGLLGDVGGTLPKL
jgi:hypothetical protein